jgi:large subunit ribosomal protein L26e
MKFNPAVTSSSRKQRRAHFAAPSHIRYRLMSSTLSKELRAKHGVRSVPVRKGDEVKILRGDRKGQKGKVTQVYRKKWAVYVEKQEKQKANGQAYNIPFQASKLMITKLHAGAKSRLARLEQTQKTLAALKQKGKGEKAD